MDIIIPIIIVISFPIFYIYGIISFFRKINGDVDKSTLIKTLEKIANNTKSSEIKNAISTVLTHLDSTTYISSNTIIIPQQSRIEHGSEPAHETSITQSAAPEKLTTESLRESFKSLENINVLMYLGAFFIVVAGSIFVGFSYETLSGIFKTALVTLTAGAFYLLGLYFYTQTKKIQPAGLTFTSIGLLLFPLVGLAVYNFILNGEGGRIVWFVTSAACLLLYLLSIRLLKKSFLSYLISFSTLSLIESSLYLFNVPVHYLSWGLTLTGILFMTINHYVRPSEEYAAPLERMSLIYVIFSVFYSFVFASTHGWIQAGGNIFLAGAYCDLLSLTTPDLNNKKALFFTSLMLFPSGLYLGVSGYLSEFNGLYATTPVAIVGVVYMLLMEAYGTYDVKWRAELLGIASGIVVFISAIIANGNNLLLFLLLGLSAFINIYIPRRVTQNYNINIYIAIFSLIIMPYVLLRMIMIPAAPVEITALAYLGLAFALKYLRYILPKIPDIHKIALGSSIINLCIAVIWIFMATQLYSVLICALCVGLIAWISYNEEIPEIIIFAIAVSYLFSFKVFSLLQNYPLEFHPYILFGIGICWYLASYYFRGKRQFYTYTRIGGIVGSFLGAYSVFTNNIFALHGSLILGVGSAQIYEEGIVRKNRNILYIAGAVALAAIQWSFKDVLHIDELQVYTIMYSAYIAGIAYIENKSGNKKDIDLLIILSMAVLTIPLGLQALESQAKGLMLIAEGLTLVLVGIGLKRKIIQNWGVGVLVIEVFYQLRGFIIGLPAWVIFGIIGLLLLGGSIALLSRRKE